MKSWGKLRFYYISTHCLPKKKLNNRFIHNNSVTTVHILFLHTQARKQKKKIKVNPSLISVVQLFLHEIIRMAHFGQIQIPPQIQLSPSLGLPVALSAHSFNSVIRVEQPPYRCLHTAASQYRHPQTHLAWFPQMFYWVWTSGLL